MQQHVRDYTELCLKDAYGIYTVQQDQIDMNINDLIEYVVEPVLKAAGYPQESVNAALYGSNEACPYKPELEKILDALHCDNMQQAIGKIDKMKLDLSILFNQVNDQRSTISAKMGMIDQIRDALDIDIGMSAVDTIELLKHKADRWDKLVDVLKTHPITEVLIDGDRYTLHSVNHKNHVLGEVIKALGLPEDAKLNDVLGTITSMKTSRNLAPVADEHVKWMEEAKRCGEATILSTKYGKFTLRHHP